MTKPPIGHKALREGRVSIPGQYYFITKTTQERVAKDWPVARRLAVGRLVQPGVPEIICASVRWLEDHELIRLYAYCLMPDHIHLLLQLGEKAELSAVLHPFCGHTGRAVYKQTGSGHLWGEAFYDHAVRDEKSLAAIADYIHDNPVRAGLVATVYDWPWSSIHESISD